RRGLSVCHPPLGRATSLGHGTDGETPPLLLAGDTVVMSQDATIVLIEDESEIRRFLRTTLPSHGFHIHEATSGQEGLIEIKTRNPDLILLDLGLPDMDGTEVIRLVREWTATPIIVLSAREQEQQKVIALDLGADDYVTKPFGINELLARIRAALRHAARPEGPDHEASFTVGDIRVEL